MDLMQSAAAAAQSAFPVGFDPTIIISIISALVGIFKNCMQPPTPAAARDHVTAAYHNGRYDAGTMRIAVHHAKIAARQAGSRIDDAEAHAVATATLDQIRTADDATIQTALDAAA